MWRALKPGLIYVGIVFAVGFALGVPRTLWLTPRLGPELAVALELPLIIAASWWASARVLRAHPLGLGDAALMGASAFAVLMVAEAALSMGLGGRSLPAHLALYAETAHQMGLAGQLVFALIPSLQVRWRLPSRPG